MMQKKLRVLAVVIGMCGMVLAQESDSAKRLFDAQIGDWKLVEGPKPYDEKTIYDYMDGAADPYMNFTYKQLYVAHYEQGKKRLVVELYDMGAPGEAYGAFTLDVNGKPEQIGNESLLSESALRLWKGQYFVNVYDASAGAVTEEGTAEIARAIAARIALAGEKPKLLAMLPAQLKPSKTRYFHRAGTFNEIYYVSTKNVLELSEKTEGVWAECELGTSKVKVALIRYPDPATCDKAWQAFCVTVFPKPGAGSSSTGPDSIYVEQVENSCTGIRKLSGAGGQPLLGFCFEAGNQEQCAKVLQSLGASGGGQAQ